MAITAAEPPLDEIVFNRPEVIHWWLDPLGAAMSGIPGPFTHMEPRFIHRYLSTSPFFDHVTYNGQLFMQSEKNMDAFQIVHDNKAFEREMLRRPGPQYTIALEPAVVTGKGVAPGQKSGVYVIRKVERLSERSEAEARQGVYPRTEVRETLYLANENMYKAPSVADVVGNRLLNATMSLEKMFERASELPLFNPTTGHTYLPPTTSTKKTATSTQGSPAGSREGSVAPMDTSSVRSGSAAPDGGAGGNNASDDFLTNRRLLESLQLSLMYEDEYMDENPLIGEPGNFKFTSSTQAIKKRKADEEVAAASAAAKAKAAQEAKEGRSAVQSPKPVVEKAPTPPPVFSEAKTSTVKGDKERKEERKRRRKSRPGRTGSVAGLTPTTPRSGPPPANGPG